MTSASLVGFFSSFAAFLNPFFFYASPPGQVGLRILRTGMLSQLSALMPQLCGLLGECVCVGELRARTHDTWWCFVS